MVDGLSPILRMGAHASSSAPHLMTQLPLSHMPGIILGWMEKMHKCSFLLSLLSYNLRTVASRRDQCFRLSTPLFILCSSDILIGGWFTSYTVGQTSQEGAVKVGETTREGQLI